MHSVHNCHICDSAGELGSGLDAICAREAEKLSIRAIRGYNPADGMLQQILFPDDAKSAGKEL